MTRRKFTSKFKTRVVLESLKERSTTQELAQKFEIAPQQINLWKREFLSPDGAEMFSVPNNNPDGAEIFLKSAPSEQAQIATTT